MKFFRSINLRIRGILNILYLLRSNKKAFNSEEFYILPHLGYGDMICCVPLFLKYAELGKKIHVFCPKNAIPLLQKLSSHANIIYLSSDDELGETEFAGTLMIYRAKNYAKKSNLPILYLGYDLLWLSSKIRPDLDIDSVFYRLARVPLSAHASFNAGLILRNFHDQVEPISQKYALVDHFPGTVREIDNKILEEISNRGLKIVFNPRDIKYENLVDLIENASELHLVNSSLLCLALLLNNKAERKVVYPINKNFYPGLYFYDYSWEECAINSTTGERYSVPLTIDRKAEHEKLILESRRFHKKFLDKILFGDYPNPFESQK